MLAAGGTRKKYPTPGSALSERLSRQGGEPDARPYVELAHLVEQGRAPYAKAFRGVFDVVGTRERCADMLALGPIADLRQCRKRGCTRLRGLSGKQRFDIDPRRLRERHRPLNTVAQLAYVAGPGILEQGLLGCRR